MNFIFSDTMKLMINQILERFPIVQNFRINYSFPSPKKLLSLLSWGAACLGVALLFLALTIYFSRPSEISVMDESAMRASIPKTAFTMPQVAYNAIGAPFLSLKFSPSALQLPDLRKLLVFYGKNGRPDAPTDKPLLHFAFNGNKAISSVAAGERLYVRYDKQSTPASYVFTEEETPLWIEAEAKGKEALVKVVIQSESGELIQEPSSHAQFNLPEKELLRISGAPWEMGKWRVDGSLLARQKARWYGIDRFLERHGGDEFNHLTNKQRIDFTNEGEDSEEIYSVYVEAGDCLVWEESGWKVVQPGEESLKHPLLIVKKVDERIMNFELWDVGGKGKVVLNLLKNMQNSMPQDLHEEFRFVGARTRSQFVFEIEDKRMLLRPQDWLVQTEDGWEKLNTPQDIDDYVERRLAGPLFVFEGVEKNENGQVLIGTLFNAARTELQTIQIPLSQIGLFPNNPHEQPVLHNTESIARRSEGSLAPIAKGAMKASDYEDFDDDFDDLDD
jgi:hypothetical protein